MAAVVRPDRISETTLDELRKMRERQDDGVRLSDYGNKDRKGRRDKRQAKNARSMKMQFIS